MKKTSRFIQLFLCLFVLLIGGVNSAWAINWSSVASTPTSGNSYYIYNDFQGKFLCYNATTNKLQLTLDPEEAVLVTVTSTCGTEVSLSFVYEETTLYMAKYGYNVSTDAYTAIKLEASASVAGSYNVFLLRKTSGLVGKGKKYLDVYNNYESKEE